MWYHTKGDKSYVFIAQRGESQLMSHGLFMTVGHILKMKEYMAEFILD